MPPRNFGYEKIVRTYLRLPIYVRRSEILYFWHPRVSPSTTAVFLNDFKIFDIDQLILALIFRFGVILV